MARLLVNKREILKFGENQYVLSGHGESGNALRKIKVGTPITIQNREELAQVSTTGGASLEVGTMVMKGGRYVGADESNNKGRSFIGTTKEHDLVVLTVDKIRTSICRCDSKRRSSVIV